MQRTLAKETPKHIGKEVKLQGWVHNHRRLGKMVFVDLRDRSGIIQVLFQGDIAKKADNVRQEWVVEVVGTVVPRSQKITDEPFSLSGYEVHAKSLEKLSSAKTPPFEINNEEKASSAGEELRLEYRYLDLRRPTMRKRLVLRSNVNASLRNFLRSQDFVEVETPILTKGTPEGAREYIVPSRNFPGKFYVLPQSPQQFKQLLMVGGIERYFQIARCFRDEDQRGDRQPEFTQLDIEMSFVDEEDVLTLVEKMITNLVKEVAPEKHLSKNAFIKMSYADAMKNYGTDKPDLRKDKNDPNELAFCFVTDFPLFEMSESEKRLVPVHHLFTSPKDSEGFMTGDVKPENAMAKQYDLALNGFEVAGGSIRIHNPLVQQKVFDILGIPKDEAEIRFGHMLKAFRFGVPPHGGIAFGLDRLIAILAGVENIREIIAMPKTGDARDPLMGAPSSLPKQQLDDAHIQVKKE